MSTSTWSDRRGLFQKGKEVHEPGRRMSGSGGGVIDAVRRASTSSNSDKVFSPLSNDPASPSSPTSQRRRVCASFLVVEEDNSHLLTCPLSIVVRSIQRSIRKLAATQAWQRRLSREKTESLGSARGGRCCIWMVQQDVPRRQPCC